MRCMIEEMSDGVWIFFFSSRRRHTRCGRDWSSDVCSSDLNPWLVRALVGVGGGEDGDGVPPGSELAGEDLDGADHRSEEHTSELQSRPHLVCRLLLEKKKKKELHNRTTTPTVRHIRD